MKKVFRTWNLFTILFTFGVGIWIPIRIVYFKSEPLLDSVFDLLIIGFILVNYYFIERKAKPVSSLRKHLTTPFGIWLDIASAAPLLISLGPFLGEDVKYLILVKIFLIRKILKIRSVLDTYDSLHPALARLIPMAFTLPMVVHFLTCGWIFIDGGNTSQILDLLVLKKATFEKIISDYPNFENFIKEISNKRIHSA